MKEQTKEMTPMEKLMHYLCDLREDCEKLGIGEHIGTINCVEGRLLELLPEERKAIEDAYYDGWNDGFYPEQSKYKSPTDYFTDKYGL